MNTKILNIQSKNRTPANTVAKLEDFDYQEGETIDPKTVITNPNISLYCLDAQNQRAIFVQTPLDIDLSQAAFFYHAQYDHAQKLIAVPLAEIPQLIEEIEPIKNLVIIYSVGRCGSTLLSKVFNQVDNVLSLSEPDVFSQIVGMRNPDGSNDDEIAELLKFCIYLIGKSNVTGKSSCCVIKLRSFCIELGELIHNVLPNYKAIFLYRNAEDYVKSAMRAFAFMSSILPTIKENIERYSKAIPLLKDYSNYIDFTDLNAIDLYTTMWLSVMQRYLYLYKKGVPACAIRYEDLVANPQSIVTSIVQYCGLPISEVDNACKAFTKDSQSGSNLSQENTRNNQIDKPNIVDIRQKIYRLLEKHPEIQTPDFIVPGTLGYDK
ncbi:MAG: sulfotransferase [Okeania sp. SIO2G4]|uniref:sulfotransferase family protein n=1 Tax=unclassified Okeania TaxID=2634635 RepID=UPI0013B6D573|nr:MULTISPECIES: sulfotransferase [unclassified Okeania]NEP74839.1 sulfotransferase [Okeania sp. SIO2G5]NEP94309.1 sulfotransferase [Okeania sp. SIO2F5]NEQ93656.1 sulfotransferase [Okeania sp. SIO2G4]